MLKLRDQFQTDGYFKRDSSNNYSLLGAGNHWAIHTGRNNEANKLVRTDGSGYLQTGYINMNTGDEIYSIGSIYYRNTTDNYIRRMPLSSFCQQIDTRYVIKNGSVEGHFSQYRQGTWTRILQFNITSGSLQPSITFEWHPTECARDAWSKFNINIRNNDIIFNKVRYGSENRTLKCVGNGTTFNVWVQGTKTGWDPYGLVQVLSTYAINSYNTTIAYQDAEPSSTYNKFADLGGYVAWADTLDGYHLSQLYWANQPLQTRSNTWTTPMFGSIYPAINADTFNSSTGWNGCDIGSSDHIWRNIWIRNLTVKANAKQVNKGSGFGSNAQQNENLYAAGWFEFKGLGGAHRYFTSSTVDHDSQNTSSMATTYFNYLYVGFVLDPINSGKLGQDNDYLIFGAVSTTADFRNDSTAKNANDSSTSHNYGFGFISIPCGNYTTTAFGNGGGRLYFGGYDHGGTATHFPRDTTALHGFSFFDYKSQLWSYYSHLNYSDSRLKANIESVTNNPKLNEIYQWAKTAFIQYTVPLYEEEQTIQNNINSDIENSDYYYYHEYEKPHYGVTAQNLHTILPELTSLDPHFNVWAVNYNELHNILFAALIKQIEDLKQEIEQLKNGNT